MNKPTRVLIVIALLVFLLFGTLGTIGSLKTWIKKDNSKNYSENETSFVNELN